ncbi:MAG: isopenicillin N synthase family dioxygenase [Kiloniellaceae bacterium]
MSYAGATDLGREAIPVIDIAAARGAAEEAAIATVGRALLRASQEIGFFYISGHGVPQAAIDRAVAAARAFFARPLEEKQRVAVNERHRGFLRQGGAVMRDDVKPDLKESFNWAFEVPEGSPLMRPDRPLIGPNNWPDDMPELRRALYGYYEEVIACARDLLRAFALALDLPADFFADKFDCPLARGSAIYYPPQPPGLGAAQFGVGPHSDYGCLTLLWQDDSGGLQVQGRSGTWVMAHPLPGTFVCNVGDLLARWSNDRFVSTPHRVINASGRERFSLPVFFDPNPETVVDPADLLAPGEAVHYPPTTAGDHVLARFNAAFSYRRREVPGNL